MSFNNHKSNNNDVNVAETLAAALGRPLDTSHSYKTMTTYSQQNFVIIAKIVKWLRETYLSGNSEPVTLEDILDETEQTDISTRTKNWLVNEVFGSNPRIRVVPSEDGQGPVRYQYKPLIDVKDRKGLRKYLMDKYQSGEGAIWYEDIMESLPNAQKTVKWLADNEYVVVIQRPVDKKKIVFYNDTGKDEKKDEKKIDDEFIKLWRSISVEGVADDKIEEYLEKHGITSIQNLATTRVEPVQRRRRVVRRANRNFKAHNEHMKGILEDYSEK